MPVVQRGYWDLQKLRRLRDVQNNWIGFRGFRVGEGGFNFLVSEALWVRFGHVLPPSEIGCCGYPPDNLSRKLRRFVFREQTSAPYLLDASRCYGSRRVVAESV